MNLDIRICLGFSALSLELQLEIASALTCLAMTQGGLCEPFASCHSERSEESQDAQDRLRVAISGKSKLKMQNDRAKMKKTVSA